MASKNIQLKSMTGDQLFPKTKGALVTNSDGLTLEGVEAGAQVNKIEKITLNGVELSISNKTVAITTDTDGYSIQALEQADSGYAATYQLYHGTTAVSGAKINIPKDMVISSDSALKKAEKANEPVEGLAVGDPYIDFVLANSDNSHIYLPVKDLVDVYDAGNGITVTGHTISIDTDVVATKSDISTLTSALDGKAAKATTLAGYGIENAYTKGEADEKFLTSSDIANKQNTITAENKLAANLVDGLSAVATSGTYSDLTGAPTAVSAFTNDAGYLVASDIANKADKATTLAGYGITDGILYDEIAD